jgi:hypothetical protein
MDNQPQAAGVHVEFYSEPTENKRKSREAGRPIFEEKEFIRIRFPADNKRVHVAPAHDTCGNDPASGLPVTYAQRHAAHYEIFKKQGAGAIVGTPLAEASFLSRSRAMELKALHIHSVEALAELNERTFKDVGMDARTLRDKARAWLGRANEDAQTTKLVEENAALKAQMALLSERLDEIAHGGVPATTEPPAEALSDADPQVVGAEFNDWKKEDIVAFLVDMGLESPPVKTKHADLVKMAQEVLATKMAAEKAA